MHAIRFGALARKKSGQITRLDSLLDSTRQADGQSCDWGKQEGVDEQNVEKGREAEFAVGDFEGVAAVLGVPGNEGIEVIGVEDLGVEGEDTDVDEAGQESCTESGGQDFFDAQGLGVWIAVAQEEEPRQRSADEKEKAVAGLDPFEVGAASADEVFDGNPYGADGAKQESGAEHEGSVHRCARCIFWDVVDERKWGTVVNCIHDTRKARGAAVACGVGDANGGFGDVSRVAHGVVARAQSVLVFEPPRAAGLPAEQRGASVWAASAQGAFETLTFVFDGEVGAQRFDRPNLRHRPRWRPVDDGRSRHRARGDLPRKLPRVRWPARDHPGLDELAGRAQAVRALVPRLTTAPSSCTCRDPMSPGRGTSSSGEVDGQRGPVASQTGLFMSWLDLNPGTTFSTSVPAERGVMLYVVRGEVEVNGVPAQSRTMVELTNGSGTDLDITSWDDGALVLLCHGDVIDEPVVAYGPFVMNTEAEIQEAYEEYRSRNLAGQDVDVSILQHEPLTDSSVAHVLNVKHTWSLKVDALTMHVEGRQHRGLSSGATPRDHP